MADTTGRDGIFDEPASEDADDFFSGGNRDAAPARRGESLDEILRDGAASDRRDESISNIHTGSKEERPHRRGQLVDSRRCWQGAVGHELCGRL